MEPVALEPVALEPVALEPVALEPGCIGAESPAPRDQICASSAPQRSQYHSLG